MGLREMFACSLSRFTISLHKSKRHRRKTMTGHPKHNKDVGAPSREVLRNNDASFAEVHTSSTELDDTAIPLLRRGVAARTSSGELG